MFGFPEPKPYTRHCGIQIDNANPEEIARIITLLALHGEAVERFLLERDRSHPEEWHLLEHNIDMSVKIVVTQDGDMELHSGATGPNTRGPVYRLTDSVHVKNS